MSSRQISKTSRKRIRKITTLRKKISRRNKGNCIKKLTWTCKNYVKKLGLNTKSSKFNVLNESLITSKGTTVSSKLYMAI